MSIIHCILHRFAREPDGVTQRLDLSERSLSEDEASAGLLDTLSARFNGKPRLWGGFAAEGEERVFSERLGAYLSGELDFVAFSRQAAERLASLMRASEQPRDGQLVMLHTKRGEIEQLWIALLPEGETLGVDEQGELVARRTLNFNAFDLAARVELHEWRAGETRRYLSVVKRRGLKREADDFSRWLGLVEPVDGAETTRALLEAFEGFAVDEGWSAEQRRDKREQLTDQLGDHASRGERAPLETLAAALDDAHPEAFVDYLSRGDHAIEHDVPTDRRTLGSFRRYTGRAGGLSISFDTTLLGSQVEYDAGGERLIIRGLPKKLKEQLERRDGE
ncbi:nucleoid-associated protein [Halotalea alkalilenta]|uniref:nucleoid-associated protein n=1 Tax=Halotalea alkalilenta TaxID=376489 RepID=UPI0004875649|nr:nucleoid-associated protein [Halotalea alkalilenta]